MAVRNKEYSSVIDLIAAGANVNCRIKESAITPLVECVENFDYDIFYQLVKNGADISERVGPKYIENSKKISLLAYAMEKDVFHERAKETYDLILNNGGDRDINYAPKGYASPAEIAYIKGNAPVLELFKKYTDLKIRDEVYKRVEAKEQTKNIQTNSCKRK